MFDDFENQVQRVLRKLGGAQRLSKLFDEYLDEKISPTKIRKWADDPEFGGEGGFFPSKYLPKVLRIARLDGIHITMDDLEVRLTKLKRGGVQNLNRISALPFDGDPREAPEKKNGRRGRRR